MRLVTYHVGSVVWLHCPQRRIGKSPKLSRNWTGPYVIIGLLSDVTARIQRSPRGKCRVVHHDRLKPCVGVTATELGFPDLDTTQRTDEESDDISDNNGDNEVTDDIVDLGTDMLETPMEPATEGPPRTSPEPAEDEVPPAHQLTDNSLPRHLVETEDTSEAQRSTPRVTRTGRQIKIPVRYL